MPVKIRQGGAWVDVSDGNTGIFPTGTTLLFYQASAPTGWTQVTTHNNKALRVVSGTGGGSGGSTAFTTVFASRTVPLVDHTHTGSANNNGDHWHELITNGMGGGAVGPTQGGLHSGSGKISSSTTTNGGHTHTLTINTASASGYSTGNTMDFSVQYIDVIICTKN